MWGGFQILVHERRIEACRESEASLLASLVVGAGSCMRGGAGAIFPQQPVMLMDAVNREISMRCWRSSASSPP